MQIIPSGSLLFQATYLDNRHKSDILATLVTGCLLLSGCGAYPTNSASGALFASRPSTAEIETEHQALGGASKASRGSEGPGSETTPPAMAPIGTAKGWVASAASTGSVPGFEADAVNVGGLKFGEHLTVNQNSLSRLRGHLTAIMPSSVTCTYSSMAGAGTDNCTVILNGISPNGTTLKLSSNNPAATVPSTVTVVKNTASATFAATVSAVASAATAVLTATANGGSAFIDLQLNPATPTLRDSASTINFGNVSVGQTATQSVMLSSAGTVPVTISGISIAGSLFTAPGFSAPLTLNPGQQATLTLQFSAPHVSTYTGVLTITSNSSQGSLVVNMSAAGVATPAVSAVSCAAGSMAGSGSDACTVTLAAAAPTGGLSVSLASNNTAVSVPANVMVPANAASAGFSATVSAVSSTQTATLMATGGGASATFPLQLSPSGQGKLNVNATSISFGSVVLKNPATQSITLSSTGTAAVTVNSASVTGTGFSLSGASFPLTLNAGQTGSLNVQFTPTLTGAASGQLTISSNSSTGATTTVSLSGTGAPHEVELAWNAPSSPSDPISGYRVYRASGGSSSYQLLNSALDAQSTYIDAIGQVGVTYQYYVTAVDASGIESTPSNTATVAIP